MDKRTREGKNFEKLSTEEKTLFLLEGIYDKLEINTSSNFMLKQINQSIITQNKIMKINTECVLFLSKISNGNATICDQYGKDLEKRAKDLGIGLGWSSYGDKKWL